MTATQAPTLGPLTAAIDMFSDARDFIDRFSDVIDGDYGTSEPNAAMVMVHEINATIDHLSAPTAPVEAGFKTTANGEIRGFGGVKVPDGTPAGTVIAHVVPADSAEADEPQGKYLHWDETGPEWDETEAPTVINYRHGAPVEASGSERVSDAIGFMENAAAMLGRGEMPARGTQYASNWRDAHLILLAALRPQPSGETREAVARIIDGGLIHYGADGVRVEDLNGKLLHEKYSNMEEASQALAKLRTDAILALLSARPLALGGQQGEAAGCAESEVGRAIYERIEKVIDAKPGTPEGDELSFLAFLVESVEEVGGYEGPPASIPAPTTPARAEAQDEGAAGERERIARVIDPTAWVFFDLATAPFIEVRGSQGDEGWVYNITWHKLGFRHVSEVRKWLLEGPVRPGVTCGAHTDLLDSLAKADAILAHPSPTPAADADRVRKEIKALTDTQFPKSCRVGSAKWVNGLTNRILAALKSTATKEGGE